MGRPKRQVLAAAEESTTPPDTLTPNQFVARVIQAKGNNLYACLLPEEPASASPTVVVELAARFRNTIWIKRNGYVLVELTPPEERRENAKVDGEIINVVRDEREWRKQPYWPAEFAKTTYLDDEDEDEGNTGKLPPSDSEGEEDDS